MHYILFIIMTVYHLLLTYKVRFPQVLVVLFFRSACVVKQHQISYQKSVWLKRVSRLNQPYPKIKGSPPPQFDLDVKRCRQGIYFTLRDLPLLQHITGMSV